MTDSMVKCCTVNGHASVEPKSSPVLTWPESYTTDELAGGDAFYTHTKSHFVLASQNEPGGYFYETKIQWILVRFDLVKHSQRDGTCIRGRDWLKVSGLGQ